MKQTTHSMIPLDVMMCNICNTTFKYSDAKLLEQDPVTKNVKTESPCCKRTFFIDVKKEVWLCEVCHNHSFDDFLDCLRHDSSWQSGVGDKRMRIYLEKDY